jgi:hypothetical protein
VIKKPSLPIDFRAQAQLERPLISVLQSSTRERPLRIIEPPFFAPDRSMADDAKLPLIAMEKVFREPRLSVRGPSSRSRPGNGQRSF